MADSVAHDLYYAPETTYGQQVAGTSALNKVTYIRFRQTGSSPAVTKSTYQSEEARKDRNIADFRHGVKEVGGDVPFELSYGSFDTILEAVLGGAWELGKFTTTPVPTVSGGSGTGATITSITVNTSGQITGVTWDSGGTGYASGDVIVFTQGELKGRYTLVAADVNATGVLQNLSGKTISDIGSGVLKNGVTRRSFNLLRDFSDIGSTNQRYHPFLGVEFNSLSLDFPTEGIVTGSFGIFGQSEGTPSDTLPGANTEIGSAPSSASPFATFNGVIKENDVVIGEVTQLTLDLQNNLSARHVIGGGGKTLRPSIGRCVVTGRLTTYLEDATLLNKFYQETSTSVEMTVQINNQSLTFEIPNLVFSSGQADSATEGPIVAPFDFQAIYDATELAAIKIIRDADTTN